MTELAIRAAETGLAKYDAMCRAIAACHQSDEASQIRNQARALEVLAKQARNLEAERKAAEIRIRAERRWGQIYKQQMKHAGGRPSENRSGDATGFDEPETLTELGITKDQSSTWQKLAEASDKQFEKALNRSGSSSVPTTNGVLRNLGHTFDFDKREAEPESDPKAAAALWVWGRVNEFKDQISRLSPAECASRCDAVMREDLNQSLVAVAAWLRQLRKHL